MWYRDKLDRVVTAALDCNVDLMRHYIQLIAAAGAESS